MPCLEPSYFHNFRAISHLCWCDNIDLDFGVDYYNQTCLNCYGLVFIISLAVFHLRDCLCSPRPRRNEAHFCTVCSNIQCLPDGTVHLRTDIAVRRAFAFYDREEARRNRHPV